MGEHCQDSPSSRFRLASSGAREHRQGARAAFEPMSAKPLQAGFRRFQKLGNAPPPNGGKRVEGTRLGETSV